MRAAGTIFFVTVALARPAFAQGHDPAAADVLFREGRRLVQAGQVAQACPKFEESYRLDPAPGTLLNMGDCEEKTGRLTQAWQHFRDVEDVLTRSSDDRAAIAHQRAEGLQKRIPTLTLRLAAGAPSGAHVLRDDVELSAASFGVALPMNPGKHTLRVVADGHKETRADLALKEGEKKDVTLEVGPLVEDGVSVAAPSTWPPPETPPRPPPHGPAGNPWMVASFAVGAAGLVATGIGAWQVLAAKSIVDEDCQGSVCSQRGLDAASRGNAFSVIGTVGAVVALAGAGAGIYFLVRPPRRDARMQTAAPSLTVEPTLGGLAFRGAF